MLLLRFSSSSPPSFFDFDRRLLFLKDVIVHQRGEKLVNLLRIDKFKLSDGSYLTRRVAGRLEETFDLLLNGAKQSWWSLIPVTI